MFDFLKKKYSLISSGVLNGKIDRHSHILFGVDDGLSTLEESLDVLAVQETAGIKEVWCTPHIMEDTPNTTDALRQRFEVLCEAYDGPIKLHLAAEYMLDNLFEERLKAGDILTMEDKTILIETSTWNPPPGLYDAIRNLQKSGYRPLLAHPERYRYLSETGYDNLYRMGIHFQLNIASLIGYYGETAQKKALYILKNGWYSEIGSDCHRLKIIQEQYTKENLTHNVLSLLS